MNLGKSIEPKHIMSLPDSHTARWFVALFHQYSLSIEYWRVLAETKTLECNQLHDTTKSLQAQINGVKASQETQDSVIERQREIIRSLEHDLYGQNQHSPTIYNVASAAPALRPQTPWPPELILSRTPSMEAPAFVSYDKEYITEVTRKRDDAPEADSPSKRQRIEQQ